MSFGQKNTKYRIVSETETETITWGEESDRWKGDFKSRLVEYIYDRNPFNDNEKSLKIFIDERSSHSRSDYKSSSGGYFIISKSDVKSEKLNFISFSYDDQSTYEFIFDSDKSTYFKLDSDSAKEIKSLDHELFLKFKKHKKVIVRKKYPYTPPIDYVIRLNGFTEAYNKYMEIKAPTMKNKSLYRVANGLANVNPFNLDKYIDKFILDAKTNHNIDLSYVSKKDRLILFRELEGDRIASAYKMNDDENVLVLVDPENWYEANQPKRWYIIYHELGHDILNLDHGECGPMMNERASDNYSWNRLEKDKSTMFEMFKSK
jgi:hypothetical protein